MNRIAPNDVLNAFADLNWLPIQGQFIAVDANECCGLTIVALARGAITPGEMAAAECTDRGATLLADRLRLDPAYVAGFVHGFDDEALDVDDLDSPYAIGFADGLNAWWTV